MQADERRDLLELYERTRTIVVVGASANIDRPAHRIPRYLQAQGYRIIPVNPNLTDVLGEKAFPSLEDVPGHIDIVNIFRRPDAVPPVVEAAIRIGAQAVWMQEGVIHQEAAEKAAAAGLAVVMDRCILKEHRKLFR